MQTLLIHEGEGVGRRRLTSKIKDVVVVHFKQLLDELFVISGIIKVEVSVISRSRRLRLIINTNQDLDYSGYHKNIIIHCFEENNDKRIITAINLTLLSVNLTLLLEIMHCTRNLKIIH